MLLPDCTLSDFTILDELFTSLNGAVYKVKHNKTLKLYALKERKRSETGDSQNIAHEVSFLSKFHHPNIIKYYGHFITDIGRLYIILEFAYYGDMQKLIMYNKNNDKQLPSLFILKVISSLSSAVSYLHSLHVVHRDLKSLNVLICENPDYKNIPNESEKWPLNGDNFIKWTESDRWIIKIGDFGIGRKLHYAQQLIHTFYGTPLYLSPEVCTKQGYSFASDMWSLGIILYEMCTLQPPFYEQNLITLAQSICNKEIPLINRTKDEFIEFFEKSFKLLLRKDPEKRPNALAYNNAVKLILESLDIKEKISEINPNLIEPIKVDNCAEVSYENINTNQVVLGKSQSMTILTRPKITKITPISISESSNSPVFGKQINSNPLPISKFANSPPADSNNLSLERKEDKNSNFLKIAKSHDDIKHKLFKPIAPTSISEEIEQKVESADPAVMQALKRQNAILQNLLALLNWKPNSEDIQKRVKLAKLRLDALQKYVDSFTCNDADSSESLYIEDTIIKPIVKNVPLDINENKIVEIKNEPIAYARKEFRNNKAETTESIIEGDFQLATIVPKSVKTVAKLLVNTIEPIVQIVPTSKVPRQPPNAKSENSEIKNKAPLSNAIQTNDKPRVRRYDMIAGVWNFK